MGNNLNEDIELLEETTDEVKPIIKKKEKGITMNLKTLFLFGLGGVALICGIVALVIYFTADRVTVRFDTDGGAKISNVKVKKGKAVKMPKNPFKKGYTFVEWQKDGKKYDFDTKVEKDITLKAIWEVKQSNTLYTITFNSKGGSPVESQEVHGNGKLIKPADPTKEHHKFIEWRKDGEKYDFDSLVTEDFELDAYWLALPTHYVTIDYDGGGKNVKQDIYEGDTVRVPKVPTKKGYTFVEWQKDGHTYDFDAPVVSDFTITAIYEEAKTWTINFDVDGDGKPDMNTPGLETQIIKDKEKAIKPSSNPSKANATFAGWTLAGEVFDFNTPITSDILLTAKWNGVNECIVSLLDNSFDGGPGSLGTLKIKCGGKISPEDVAAAAEKRCAELYPVTTCYTKVVYNNQEFNFGTTINENIELYLVK